MESKALPVIEQKPTPLVETAPVTESNATALEAPPIKQIKIQTVEDLHVETAKEMEERKERIHAQKVE